MLCTAMIYCTVDESIADVSQSLAAIAHARLVLGAHELVATVLIRAPYT